MRFGVTGVARAQSRPSALTLWVPSAPKAEAKDRRRELSARVPNVGGAGPRRGRVSPSVFNQAHPCRRSCAPRGPGARSPPTGLQWANVSWTSCRTRGSPQSIRPGRGRASFGCVALQPCLSPKGAHGQLPEGGDEASCLCRRRGARRLHHLSQARRRARGRNRRQARRDDLFCGGSVGASAARRARPWCARRAARSGSRSICPWVEQGAGGRKPRPGRRRPEQPVSPRVAGGPLAARGSLG